MSSNQLFERIGVNLPIVQAPMAGISTPAMAGAVSNSGALGSIAIGAERRDGAEKMILATRELTKNAFNVNVFCHKPIEQNVELEKSWLRTLAPQFAAYESSPPESLREIYQSFLLNDEMLELLLELKPKVVSFHFGLPSPDSVAALRNEGIILFGSATNLNEAKTLASAGIDAIVAQGYEAGGHRGIFDSVVSDDRLSVAVLTRLLVCNLDIPVIAAGGIMDGAGIASMLRLGATAAQLGTAFLLCPESAADQGYRAAMQSDAALHTVMTSVISGRPARCLANRFTELAKSISPEEIPGYPRAYDAAKALHAAAGNKAEFGFGAQWAGQGAPLVRTMSAADLIRTLELELKVNQAT